MLTAKMDEDLVVCRRRLAERLQRLLHGALKVPLRSASHTTPPKHPQRAAVTSHADGTFYLKLKRSPKTTT